PRPRFVTGTTHQWPIGLLDPTRPPLPLPRPTIPPKATSRDPAARRRTRALWGLCPRDGERRRFTSRILPPYMRRSPKVAEVLPVLYLRGLSTGDFREALAALLGDDAAGLSATNIARLTNEWETEYRAFQKRSLADRDY